MAYFGGRNGDRTFLALHIGNGPIWTVTVFEIPAILDAKVKIVDYQ